MFDALKKSQKNTRLFSDETLTKKAALNSLSSFLNYFVQMAVAFVITPFMITGLGDFFYGTWQTLNRVVGYLSPAVGKPTQTLRWTLANQQSSTDFDQKRRYIGSAVDVWLFFLPIYAIGGSFLTWFVPFWLKTPVQYFWQVRLTTILLIANLAMLNFSALPQSVLEGENLGYKRMGLSALLTIVGGVLTWLVLVLGQGMVGVASVAFLVTTVSGVFYLIVARSNISWFGLKRPDWQEVRSFFSLSTWFIAWDVVMKLMVVSDVIILAFLGSVESVTSYSLTKYAPETVISFVSIIVFSAVPGLGGIIGSGQIKRAGQLRGEIMSITWLMLTVLSTCIVLWNHVFIYLWVGDKQFSGALANFLMILVVYQFTFIKNDASIIDLTLKIEQKVLIGLLSVSLTVVVSGILVGYYHLGVVGLCSGIIIGRLILSIAYPVIVGKFLNVSLMEQLNGIIRPAFITILLLSGSYAMNSLHLERHFSGVVGWLLFINLAILSSLFLFVLSFFLGFTGEQRGMIWNRIKHLIPRISGNV